MILQQQSTQLGGSSVYNAGNYGEGLYGSGADNFVILTPTPGSVWVVDGVLSVTTSQSFTQFAAYLNTLDPTGLLGTTVDGNLDEVPIPETRMTSGDSIIGVWFGGDPGAQATASLDGAEWEPE